MMKSSFFVALTVFAAYGCAYWNESGSGTTPKNAATKTDSAPIGGDDDNGAKPMLRLLGSSTVGAGLAPRLVQGYLKHAGATDVTVDSSKKDSNHITVSAKLSGRAVSVVIDYPGSGEGFKGLQDGRCDIAMSSRPIKSDEVDKLRDFGDMTSPTAERVVAMDGIAVIVNRANRLTLLTVDQVGNIFAGRTKNFKEVGGPDQPIHLFSRDKKSGTYDAFVGMAMGGREVDSGAKVMDDNESLSSAVASDPAGIGFVGLPFVKDAKALAVQDGDATPQSPTPLAVSTEDYPFSRRLYLYTSDKPKSDVAGFTTYAASDDGQEIVSLEGFIALGSAPVTVTLPANAPDDYRTAVEGASRLPFNFRFRPGTTTLDAKGRADVSHVARTVTSRGAGHDLLLIGFADRSGNEPQNVELSKGRAKAVSDALKSQGVSGTFTALGFGSALPVAPNDSAEGRERNRRVEVWIK